MSFYAGLLRGIQRGAVASREEAARRQVEQDAREEKILNTLASSDDPEISQAAFSGLMHLATGDGRRKKDFLSNLMGAPPAENPSLTNIMKMVREPVEVTAGMPAASFGGVESGPAPPASQQAPTGASAAMAPPPGQPGSMGHGARGAAPPPVDASLAGAPTGPPPRAAGPSAMNGMTQRPMAQNPTQNPASNGAANGAETDLRVAAVTPMMPPPLMFRGIKLGRDTYRTPPVTMARRIFLPPDEKARRTTLAKASAEVEGEVAGLVAAGFTPIDARALIKEKYERNARGTSAAGSVQSVAGQLPDGRQAFGVFDRRPGSPTLGKYLDSTTGEPLIGFQPRTITGSSSMGTDREAIALAIYGKRYALLDQSQQRDILARELQFNEAEAFRRGTGSGDASINTEMRKPIGIAAGAEQGLSPTTTLAELNGIIPITDDQRTRLTAARSLAGDMAQIDALVRRVFPAGWDPFTTKGALAYKAATADVDFATLRSKIQLAIGNVAKVLAAESGRLTQQDIERAQVALTNLDAKLLEGETQETALAKVQQITDGLNKVLSDIKTPRQQMLERGVPLGGGPPGLQGSAGGGTGAAAQGAALAPPPTLLNQQVMDALGSARVSPGQQYVIAEITLPDGTTQVWAKDASGRITQIK